MSTQLKENCLFLTADDCLGHVSGSNGAQIITPLIKTPLTHTTKDVKALTYAQLCQDPKYKEIGKRLKQELPSIIDKSKILIFPAKGSTCGNSNIQDEEVFFVNNETQTYMTTKSLATSKGLRSTYLHLRGDEKEQNAQVIGSDFVIAGHAEDTVLFKIPWDKKWGDGLPESSNLTGFNNLYDKIKQQQNQIANDNNQTDTNNAPLTNNNQQTTPKICINFNHSGIKHSIIIESNKTIRELKQEIREKVDNPNFEVTFNSQKLNMDDDGPLSSVFGNRNQVTLMIYNAAPPQPYQNNTNTAFTNTNIDNNSNNYNATANSNPAPQNDTITLYCTNISSKGLNNFGMPIYHIDVRKNLTVDKTKDEILKAEMIIDNKPTNLKAFNVKKDDFVVCKADDNGKPIRILKDDEKISDVFNISPNYDIIPKVVTARIAIDGTQQDFNYPVIVNNEFNDQTLKEFIMNELENENKTIVSITDQNTLNKKGYEVSSGVDNCFFRINYKNVKITTKPITVVPVQVPAQQITTTTDVKSNTYGSNANIFGELGVINQSGSSSNQFGNNTISNYNTNSNLLKGRTTGPNTVLLGNTQAQQLWNMQPYKTKNQSLNYQTNIISNTNPYKIKRYYLAAPLNNNRSKRRKKSFMTYKRPPKMYNNFINPNHPITQSQSINGTVNMMRPASTSSNQNQVSSSNQNIINTNQTSFNIKLNTTVRQPQYGPVPAKPPVSPVPVAPVQQSCGSKPGLNTLYEWKYVSKAGQWGWQACHLQENYKIPNYQQFIDYNIGNNLNGIYTYGQQWQPKYQYVDEFGWKFTSDRPIFKDANNNLVTLSRATYEPPL